MTVVLIIAIACLVVLSGTFSCSDIVYATVNKLRLKKEAENGSKTAELALSFANSYETTVTTILFSNNLVNIAASSLGAVLSTMIFPNTELAPTIMSMILLVTILIFGEILPKVIGRSYSYQLSKILIYLIVPLKYVFFPIVWLTSTIGKGIASLFIKKSNDESLMSDDELEEMVEAIEEEGVIDEEQSELLQNAIDFKETQAFEIMTPRIDMFAVDIDDDIRNLMKDDHIFIHSRIPVYKNTIDNIIGMLPTKSLLRNILAKKTIDISTLMVPVNFVPGTMGISEILKLMQKTKNHIVIVKDEFGGTDGLLTMEDILEELVGEMWDELDTVHLDFEKIKKNNYIVDGGMNIEEFFELVNVDLPEDIDYTTVGGWCIDMLGRFAVKGDKIKYKNLRIEITDVTDFTVEKLFVKVVKPRLD